MTRTRPVCTNLSYVLHEPSTSQQVAEYARRIEARQSEIGKLVSRLGSLGDERLRSRIVLDPRKAAVLEELQTNDKVRQVLSLRLGAWRLLNRILQTVGVSGPSVAFFDTPAGAPSSGDVTWFHGHSLIGQPAVQTGSGPTYLVLAIVRPGDETVLLDIERITPQAHEFGFEAADQPRWPVQLLRAAENAIRSHPDQWCCELPLWSLPVEAALSEFQVE